MSDEIRACVLAADGYWFYTWLSNDVVMRCTRESETQMDSETYIGTAHNVDMFNAILERHGVAPLAPKGTPKRPERTGT